MPFGWQSEWKLCGWLKVRKKKCFWLQRYHSQVCSSCLHYDIEYIQNRFEHCDIYITFFPCAGDVWFSLRGTTYQNNSCVALEDIGEGTDALLCVTNLTACCTHPYIGNGSASGNWFFPNGTKIPSDSSQWDFYRTRGEMVVRMCRRRGGVEGIYCCEIRDSTDVTQTIYIGVYTAGTGEWHLLYTSVCLPIVQCLLWSWYVRKISTPSLHWGYYSDSDVYEIAAWKKFFLYVVQLGVFLCLQMRFTW